MVLFHRRSCLPPPPQLLNVVMSGLGHNYNILVVLGLEAWASGRLEDFGKLIADSGRSSIVNYECGML